MTAAEKAEEALTKLINPYIFLVHKQKCELAQIILDALKAQGEAK